RVHRGSRTPAARHVPVHAADARRPPLPVVRPAVHARQPRAARQHQRAGRRPDGRAVLAQVLPRRRDQRPRLGPLRDQPAQRLRPADRRQQHVRVQRGDARAHPWQLRRSALLRHGQRLGGQLGHAFQRPAERRRHGPPLPDPRRPAAVRLRLPAQSDSRTGRKRQSPAKAVARALQHRAGLLMRRLSRILLWTAGALLTLVLLAGIVVETSFFKNWLRGFIVRQANERLEGTLAIGRLHGSLFSGIELDDVRVMLDNQPVISIDAITSRYTIRELVSGGVTIDNVTLVHPVVAAHREGDGWQLSRLIKKDANEADRRGPSKPINIRHINITNGHFTVDKKPGEQSVNIPDTYDAFEAALSFAYAPVHFTIGIDRMTFAASNPTLEIRQVNGAIAVESDKINFKALTVRTAETCICTAGTPENYLKQPTFKLAVSLTPLSLPEVHRLVPAVAEMHVTPTVNVRLSGTLEGLATEFSAKSSAGNFSGKGKVAVAGPDRVFQGEVAVHHLDLAPFLNNAEQKSDITVYAKVDVRGPAGFDTLRGTVAADAPHVETHGYVVTGIRANAKIDGRKINFDTSERAYRSNTTAAGSVEFASDARPETRFDLRGVVKDVGLTYLPKQTRVPPVETKLTANYHVRIVIPRKPGWHVDGDVTLGTSSVAGVTVADGSKASFFVEPNVVRYEADATVAGVDLKRIGDSFNITALQQPRYQTNLNGHGRAKVDGTAVEKMTLNASGELNDSTIFGGTIPQLTFESSIANNDLHVKASGELEKINPAIAAGKPSLDGSITGSIDAVELTMQHLSQGTDLNSVAAYVLADFGPSS